jgi:hypothetical protein
MQGVVLAAFIGLVCGVVVAVVHKELMLGVLIGLGCGALCLPGTLAICSESFEKQATKKDVDPWDTDYL